MIVHLNDWVDAGKHAEGVEPASSFGRLNDFLDGSLSTVTWTAKGWRVATQGASYDQTIEPYQRFVQVTAHCTGQRVCARCLKPLALAIQVDNTLEVFQNEASADDAAMSEDADLFPDPIVTSKKFNLIAQVEEELLLELDLHAVHEPLCELPAPVEQQALSPFAALASLKKS